ncbi:MAG: DUF4962 domain-containing protein [Victivallaceae bacterium]|nr:DUF4962 domain-containing protein [Victivallaceae bacterium]
MSFRKILMIAVMGFGAVRGFAGGAAVEGPFNCDFEWIAKPSDYAFLELKDVDAMLVKEGKNAFIELKNTQPRRYLVFEMKVNMLYNPGMVLRFSHREPGDPGIGLIAIGMTSEQGGRFYRQAAIPSEKWQECEVPLASLENVAGPPATAETVMSSLTIYARIPDTAEPAAMTLDLDNVELYAGEAPPLTSEANPPLFNWRRGLGKAMLEYSQNPAFPSDATVKVETSNNFFMPQSPLAAGRWYYRVTAADGYGTPVVKLDIVPEARVYNTSVFDPAMLLAKPRPWLNCRREMSAGERARLLAEFKKNYTLRPGLNPRSYHPGDPEYPSFISWYGGVHDRIVISAGRRLQTLAEILAATGDSSLAPQVLDYALELCSWDPNDGSGHLSGDIGAYHVQRGLDAAYDALHTYYDAETLKPLRDMIKYRAEQVWTHLNPFPRGQRKEYNNHAWLAVYGMAEAGVVLTGDDPDAEKYVEYARELFLGLFLAVQGFDGENGEGIGYWSYGGNFLKLYAQMMKEACGVDMFTHPWLGRTIMFPIYTCIPNSYAVSFADSGKPNHSILGPKPSEDKYIEELAVLSNNPYGVWYANKPSAFRGLAPKIPADIPQSVYYPQIGWGVFNTSLVDGLRNVTVAQRAAVFGSAHQHDDQNNILINAYGDELIVNSGYYDYFGSPHFNGYSIRTRAHNTLLVDGRDQDTRRTNAGGALTTFVDNPGFGYMVGEAGNPTVNNGKLTRWTRRTIFIKPEFVITHDIVEAEAPVQLEYLMHSVIPLFAYQPNQYFDIVGTRAELYGRIIHPVLNLNISSGYPINPVRPRGNNEPLDESVISREWHLDAATPGKVRAEDIMVAMQIRKQPAPRNTRARMVEVPCENGRAVAIRRGNDNLVLVLSRLSDAGPMRCGNVLTNAKEIYVAEFAADGTRLREFTGIESGGGEVRDIPGIELFGAKLSGVEADRAADVIRYYSGTVRIPETKEYANPFDSSVNVIVDMRLWHGGTLEAGDHFVVVSSLKRL